MSHDNDTIDDGGLLFKLLFFIFLIIIALAFVVLTLRYRNTVLELRKNTEAAQAKYELVRATMDDMTKKLNRLQATVVQRDAEILQLKNTIQS